MTPGDLNIPIFRGAKWSFAFEFIVTETDLPVDLTGLGPFVCEVRDFRSDRLLETASVISNYDSQGLVTVTLTPSQTRSLKIGKVRMGLRDAEGNSYLEGSPDVRHFTPSPP